jgi:hypothetical protein
VTRNGCHWVVCSGPTVTNTNRLAMAQVVSRLPLTLDSRIRDRSVHVEFVVNKVALGRFFFSNSVLRSHHSSVAPYAYVIWGITSRPFGGRSSDT